MIQVCSQCGTRWNVRDRQRVWCPRCRGTLLAPTGQAPAPGWNRPSGAPPQGPDRPGPRPPSGYRWVAVRPGAPPQPRRGRRDLGPTPRYQSIPRWGLVEHFDAPDQQTAVRTGPSPHAVRVMLLLTLAGLGAAAFVHVVRYILLIVNRTVLLNPWVAAAATWGGVAVSVIAAFLVVATALVLTNWLIARRAAAYAHTGRQDPRTPVELWVGALTPLVNLVWAPVYVIELAEAEGRWRWLQRSIITWWVVWVLNTAVSVFSIATSFTTDPQGIADNTVATIVAYLFAAASLLLVGRVFAGFEEQSVERPTHRWVVVPTEEKPAEPAAEVEPDGENPAA
ncbi:DUF4328 domain-containing protein [Mycolicibacterium parafortuitum]|uniref:DUF4328 domain-containing protein n=1 Tax=Mycolicibacterium parafortuitum TaxID=39692 RepID=UPI0009F56B22|nr:DUF4328 domain-containing protein [Mycolicibacterium parafortuitum]ORB27046.1 hypothetical protein BST38_25465 [Mycolicibacterium parafortuitum]